MRICLEITFVVILLIFTVNSDTQNSETVNSLTANSKKCEYEYRCGRRDGFGNNSRISLFNSGNKQLQYHAFSLKGQELFSSTQLKKVVKVGCEEDEERIYWQLIPDTILNNYKDLESQNRCLVVGTSEKKVFFPPRLEQITLSCYKCCFEALVKTDSLMIDSSKMMDFRFHSAGTDGHYKRVFVEQANGLIAVCQIRQGKCDVLFAKSHFSSEKANVLFGQADLSGDGLCDVFALDAGDYGGKWVLVNEDESWTLIREKGPVPC